MFIAASGKKGIKPRRGGMFISAVAKTPSKIPKLTPMVRFPNRIIGVNADANG